MRTPQEQARDSADTALARALDHLVQAEKYIANANTALVETGLSNCHLVEAWNLTDSAKNKVVEHAKFADRARQIASRLA